MYANIREALSTQLMEIINANQTTHSEPFKKWKRTDIDFLCEPELA